MREGLNDAVVPTPDPLWSKMLETVMEGHSEITLSDFTFTVTFHQQNENRKETTEIKKVKGQFLIDFKTFDRIVLRESLQTNTLEGLLRNATLVITGTCIKCREVT